MKTRIKLGFIANDLAVGGVSSVLINLCNQLPSSLFEIHLILLSKETPMEQIIPLNESINKHFFDYPFNTNYSLLTYLKSAYFKKETELRAKSVLNKIKELKLDILHFHTLPRQLTIGQIAKKQNPKLRLVFTDHLVRISDGEYKKHQSALLTIAYKKLYANYNVIAVSKAVQQQLQKRSIQDSNRQFKLLENSIDITAYNRDNDITTIKRNYVVYISRMNHHKGQNTLIEAWKQIKQKDKGQLVLIGPDESNGKFHKMAKEDASIIFTGSISNIKEHLNRSTLAIFPSQKEGLPIALLEMMAYKLPIICSDIPELTSIINDQQEGLHFKLDNVNDLVEKINFALNNKEKMAIMGKNARSKVESICQANNPVLFHEKFYQLLLR